VTADIDVGDPSGLAADVGRLRGLSECASDAGTLTVLALDQRRHLRALFRSATGREATYEELVEFKLDVVTHLARGATGLLLDPELGAAQAIASGRLPGGVGLIVSLEASAPGTARLLDGWGVGKARAIGASAAKLLIHYRTDAPDAAVQEKVLDAVAGECARAGLPLFVEALGFALDDRRPYAGQTRADAVVATARRLSSIGGDVLKLEFPFEAGVTDEALLADACTAVTAATPLPWVLLSAGVARSDFERQVSIATASGASGVVAGRTIWGEAVGLDAGARRTFLETIGIERLRRLRAIVERSARPVRLTRDDVAEALREGWPRRDW
jgi:tagatose 1,6-diphosphate aldolase